MKHALLKVSTVAGMFALYSIQATYAQDQISSLMKSGLNDIQEYANLYLEPLGRGMSSTLGQNWYNTAQAHKIGGFDITVGGGAALMPSSMKTFKITNSTFNNIRPEGVDEVNVSTISGEDKSSKLDLVAYGVKVTDFDSPGGIGYSYMPMANVQLAVGLPFKTEIMVRLIPKLTFDDASVKQFGIGIKHNIFQWIPVVKDLPMDGSVVVAYSRFNANYKFSDPITPTDIDPTYTGNWNEADYENQKVDLNARAFTMNFVFSKKLLFFTPYLGLGFTRTTFDLGLKGTYPIYEDDNLDVSTNDPVKVDYKNFQTGATLGFRLKILWVLAFHAQYTFQKYPVALAGFGINIR